MQPALDQLTHGKGQYTVNSLVVNTVSNAEFSLKKIDDQVSFSAFGRLVFFFCFL